MSYQTSTAVAEFDFWSKSYDWSILQLLLFGPSHRVLLKQLTLEDKRVLDIGCGTGRFAVKVLQQNPEAEVWGVDISEKMMVKGKKRCQPLHDRLHFVRGNSEYLPFEDNSFDVITCSHSFHHYPDQVLAVEEMYRVLRPDGKLLLIDGYRDNWWGWFIFDILVTTIEGGVLHCSAKRLRRLFQHAGFDDVVQERRQYFIPYFMTVGIAKKQVQEQALPLSKVA